MERKGIGFKQNQTSMQRKLTPINPRVTREKSVKMVNTRSNKEQKTKKKLPEEPNAPVKEIDLETPDGAEQKATESTPMPDVEEQGTETIEFSPIGNGDDITNDTSGKKRQFTN